MTSFIFSGQIGQTIAFDPVVDSIVFGFFDGEAIDFRFAEVVIGTARAVRIFRATDEEAVNAGNTSLAVTLTSVSGGDLRLSGLVSSNFTFFGPSAAFFGDETTGFPAVGSTAPILDDAAQALTGTSAGELFFGFGENDTIVAAGGNDFAQGNAGNDIMLGGAGDDVLRGGQGDDTIEGGEGADTIFGDVGDDLIDGVSGRNVAQGNAGNDTLFGSADNDSLRGGQGDDSLRGNGGQDTLRGDLGNDIIVIAPGPSEQGMAFGGGGDDTLDGRAANIAATLIMNGNQGADSLIGGVGKDTLRGGQGDDTIIGGLGNDQVFGDFGNDSLFGAEGDDSLFGGEGNDVLVPNTGDDRLDGGGGNDRFDFEPVNLTDTDTLIGGSGEDTVAFNGSSPINPTNFANVFGIDVIQSPGGGPAVFDNVFLNRTDLGQVRIDFFSATSEASLTVDTSAVSANFDVLLSRQDDEIFRLQDGGSHRVVSAGISDLLIFGSNMDDTIVGSAGVEEIRSDEGRDIITLGGGTDVITYGFDGAAANVIALSSNASNGINQVDVVNDFLSLTDQVQLFAVIPDVMIGASTVRANVTYGVVSGNADSVADVLALITGTFNHGGSIDPMNMFVGNGNGDVQNINITGGEFIGRKFAAIGVNDTPGFQSDTDVLLELAGTSTSIFQFDIVEHADFTPPTP